MRLTVLSTGPIGAAFTAAVAAATGAAGSPSEIDVVCGTGDDITVHGLRVCPDVDAVLDALGDRPTATGTSVSEALVGYGAGPAWLPMTDGEVATHLARTSWLAQGLTLSEVTARLAERRGVSAKGVRLRPMSDVPVETHAVLDGPEEQRAVHVQQWRRELGGEPAPTRFVVAGLDRASAAPGVLDAIRRADVVLLAPGDPVTGLGVVLSVPGVRDALRGCTAPVVGVSPVGTGALTDPETLAAVGVEPTSAGIAGLYRDLLHGWLVGADEAAPPPSPSARWLTRSHTGPLDPADPEVAAAALRLAAELTSGSAGAPAGSAAGHGEAPTGPPTR